MILELLLIYLSIGCCGAIAFARNDMRRDGYTRMHVLILWPYLLLRYK